MNREEFLYQYLLKYNKYEEKFEQKNAVAFWKENDKNNNTSGMLFMVLRNALVHNTLETISQIEKVFSFSDVLDDLNKCKLISEDKKKYIDIIFKNEKVLNDLEDKGFKLINTSRKDVFKLFQRKESVFNSSIFFSYTNSLFETSVSTYNQQENCREYYDGYYIETELNEGGYILKFSKYEDTIVKKKIIIYLDKGYKIKTYYKYINHINVSVLSKETKHYIEKNISSQELEKLKNSEIKELINTYVCESTIRNAANEIKNSYNNLNEILHIIGVQNEL